MRLTKEERAARKANRAAARAQAIADREARRIAAGRPKPETIGDVLGRLKSRAAPPAPIEPAEGPGGFLPARRAVARESTAEVRNRLREAARQREAAIRAAESKLSSMTPEDRAALLDQLRLGVIPLEFQIPPIIEGTE
jgi:hypothetical protein